MAKKAYDIATVKSAAHGRHAEVISSICQVDISFFDGRQQSCPKCGGTDRFRFFSDDTGGAICNQCFRDRNGDFLSVIQWLTGRPFTSALEAAAEYLRIPPQSPSKNGHAKRDHDPAEHLRFLPWDDGSLRLLALWCASKPPITAEAVISVGSRFAIYRDHYPVIALPVYGPLLAAAPPHGWCLDEITGGKLPVYSPDGNGKVKVEWVKRKLTRGSKPGLIGQVGEIAAAETIWKLEGPTDLLAMISAAGTADSITTPNGGHAVITNSNGANEKPEPWVIELLAGKSVNVVHDADVPGQVGDSQRKNGGARRWCAAFALTSSVVRNVQLPFPIVETHGLDLRDYFAADRTINDLLALAEATPPETLESTADALSAESLSLSTDRGRTDAANAARFAKKYGDDIRFCAPWSKWLIWDGRRWQIDDALRIESLAKECADEQWGELTRISSTLSDSDHAAATRFARASSSANGVRYALLLARSESGIPVLPATLDTDPLLFNAANGTVDLRTGSLQPHSRDDRLTKLSPVDYDPDALAPTWLHFIDQIFDGEAELIRFVQRAAGYTLTGLTFERCLFFLHGSRGRNGKTTLVTTIQKVMGEYSVSLTKELLTADSSKGIPTEVCDLFGARMAVTTETEEGSRFAESLIKQMTGGEDRIKGRRLYAEHFEFAATHKIWICGNHKPRIRGTDDAIWDRIRLIPFKKRFDEPDKSLPAKLESELPGILAWAVRGCVECLEHGLGEPDEVRQATQGYRSEMDVLARFIDERCLCGPPYQIKSGQLYESYKKWCETSGEYCVSISRFGNGIEEKGFEKHRSNGIWYLGISIREDF